MNFNFIHSSGSPADFYIVKNSKWKPYCKHVLTVENEPNFFICPVVCDFCRLDIVFNVDSSPYLRYAFQSINAPFPDKFEPIGQSAFFTPLNAESLFKLNLTPEPGGLYAANVLCFKLRLPDSSHLDMMIHFYDELYPHLNL